MTRTVEPQELSSACVAVLYQVRRELAELVEAKEFGTITIHCSDKQLIVEVNRKRKAVPLWSKPEPR